MRLAKLFLLREKFNYSSLFFIGGIIINIDYRENNKWTVYIHVNKTNGKCYVGITTQKPYDRWGSNGCNYKGQVFYNAIRKYGWDM